MKSELSEVISLLQDQKYLAVYQNFFKGDAPNNIEL
tara:strand:+ start:409 stop:516 length:108 start_codon:yes stop_codon:yes gene_type:complete